MNRGRKHVLKVAASILVKEVFGVVRDAAEPARVAVGGMLVRAGTRLLGLERIAREVAEGSSPADDEVEGAASAIPFVPVVIGPESREMLDEVLEGAGVVRDEPEAKPLVGSFAERFARGG